jgi:hypothetical protein
MEKHKLEVFTALKELLKRFEDAVEENPRSDEKIRELFEETIELVGRAVLIRDWLDSVYYEFRDGGLEVNDRRIKEAISLLERHIYILR